MTGEEKRAWIHGSTSLVAYLIYLAVVLLTGLGYVAAMLWCIGAGVAATLFLYAVIAARGPREPKDERDALYLGFVLSALLEAMARIAAYRRGLPGQHAW
jgi:4-hydroxybenzoate polyprenyltransferase